MNPISHRIQPDPKDCRRLLLDDGRPVLSVVGGGHARPFTPQEMATISAWICECWNALSVAQPPNARLSGPERPARKDEDEPE